MENNFEYKEEYGWITSVCLNVTDACNLACRYCFVEQHPHYMTLDIAKQAVHFILDNLEKKNKQNEKQNRASITYFGGEPTIMWDEIIIPLTNYIRENNFPINLNMTTNGTLLNKERIEFMKNNNINPLLSIDGDRKTQEYNRPCHNSNQSSFDLVEKNIPDLLDAFPNLTFRSTIYADTVENTFKNYVFAMEQGFKNIFMIPDGRHSWTEEKRKILYNEFNKIFALQTNLFENNIYSINYSLLNEAYTQALQLIQPNYNLELNVKRGINRCGLGITGASVSWDGKIYGCQEQPSFGKDDIFYIGDLNQGIDKEKHKHLLSVYNTKGISKCNNIEQCETCLLRKICVGFGCPSFSWDLYKNFLILEETQCSWREHMAANAIASINYLLNQNNKIFIKYMKKNYDSSRPIIQESELFKDKEKWNELINEIETNYNNIMNDNEMLSAYDDIYKQLKDFPNAKSNYIYKNILNLVKKAEIPLPKL